MARTQVVLLLAFGSIADVNAADSSCAFAEGSASCGPRSEIEVEMQLAAERGAQYLQRKRMEAMGTKGHSLMQSGSKTRKAILVDESTPEDGRLPQGLFMPTSFNPFRVDPL